MGASASVNLNRNNDLTKSNEKQKNSAFDVVRLLSPDEWKIVFGHKKAFCSMAETRSITVLDFFKLLNHREQSSALENIKFFNRLCKSMGGIQELKHFSSEEDRFFLFTHALDFSAIFESLGGTNGFFQKLLLDEQRTTFTDPFSIWQLLQIPGGLEGLRSLPEKALFLEDLQNFCIHVNFLGGIETFKSLPYEKRLEILENSDGFRTKMHRAVESLGGIESFRQLPLDQRIAFLTAKLTSKEI